MPDLYSSLNLRKLNLNINYENFYRRNHCNSHL